MELKKSEKADLEKKRSLFFQLGVVIALAVVLVAFEWKSYDEKNYSLGQLKVEDVPEEIIPITKQETKPPPPPPPPAPVLNIVKNDIEIKNEAKIEENEVDEDTKVEVREIVQKEEVVEETQIFTIVESMPEFPGGERALLEYVTKNIKYPQIAKDNGISGRVFVTFVIDQNGSVADVRILRGIGGGCDEEAVRVVKTLPKWSPGKQRGKPVKVQYNLPVNFVLR